MWKINENQAFLDDFPIGKPYVFHILVLPSGNGKYSSGPTGLAALSVVSVPDFTESSECPSSHLIHDFIHVPSRP